MPEPYDSCGKKVNEVRTHDVFGGRNQKAATFFEIYIVYSRISKGNKYAAMQII